MAASSVGAGVGGVASGGEGGQMDEVITRITEHEGGAMDRCHHQANSWRLKPLQQLADNTDTQTHAYTEKTRTHIHTHTHTHTNKHTHKQKHTVFKNYLHLYWKDTSGQCCGNQCHHCPATLLFVYTAEQNNGTIIKTV